MFLHMAIKNRRSAYLRTVPGLSLVMQQGMAEAAGCDVTYGETAGRDIARERDRWIKDSRPGDTLWLSALRCLVLPAKARPPRYRPSADMAAVISELSARGVEVVDAQANVSTRDPAAWGAHVRRVVASASQIDRRRKARRASGETPAGVVTKWRSAGYAKRLQVQRAVWTGAGHTDDVVPLLDPELARLSTTTLYAILGPRRPGDKRAGGRPRKTT